MRHRKLKNSELDRLSTEGFKESQKLPLIIVLDNIRSLNNVGSVFRTADAFRIQKIYLCGITATPPHKDITKTALGATESVEWEHVKDPLALIKKLQEKGVYVFSVEQAEGAQSLLEIQVNMEKTYAIVFGNEVKGIQQSVVSQSDGVIEIPQYGTKHSLNISVSVGIVVWDMVTKLKSF